MTHTQWVTHSPTADNGLLCQSEQSSGSLQKSAKRRGSNGLFPLMVKTFCSGGNHTHCRDCTFYIHEMSRRRKRKWDGENEKENGDQTEQEGPPPPPIFMLQGASRWGGADQWTCISVQRCWILCIKVGGCTWRLWCPWTTAAFMLFWKCWLD